MSVLPDEMWRRIMEIGVEAGTLNYNNLCCLSITCRRLRRLASDDSLWSTLIFSDFPFSRNDFNLNNSHNNTMNNSDKNNASASTAEGKFKSLYKIRYEKDKEQKRLAHRRVVLRIESGIAEHLRKIKEIELQSLKEKEKLNKAVAALINIRRVRHASVALNVWQPEVIRGRQTQMIQQCNVPIDFRINAVEMELSLCKQQIAGLDKALSIEKRRLDEAKEKLASVKYHPLQDFKATSLQPNESRIRTKKLKHSTLKF